MKIAIGSDHRGYNSKEVLKSIITNLGHEFIDMGTNDSNPIDYPDIACLVAMCVSNHEADQGILICATGIGMSITANKIKGIRAALCHDAFSAIVAREHNDANILCISGDQSGEVVLRKMVENWLDSEFSGGRHLRRVNKISSIEQAQKEAEV